MPVDETLTEEEELEAEIAEALELNAPEDEHTEDGETMETTEADESANEIREKWRESCARAIMQNNAAQQAKTNHDDKVLIDAFNLGRKRVLAEKSAQAAEKAAREAAKAKAEEEAFWDEMQRFYGPRRIDEENTQSTAVPVTMASQKAKKAKKKKTVVYHAELGSVSEWMITIILLLAFAARLAGVA